MAFPSSKQDIQNNIAHIRELLGIHRSNLNRLEIQRAKYGFNLGLENKLEEEREAITSLEEQLEEQLERLKQIEEEGAIAVSPPRPAAALPAARTVRVREKDGAEMVCVPAGEFLMGSADSDDMARDNEKPQHTVYLDAFWIDKCPVTNAQFEKFVAATNYRTDAEKAKAEWEYPPGREEVGMDWRHPFGPNTYYKANHPVVQVSWKDARAYCVWAGGRLPTEAEWEKAAGWDERNKRKLIYPWGDQWEAGRCNSREIGVEGTTPVGAYPQGASPYGALDMAGNVWDWVADWYDDGYYAVSPERNPTGPSSGQKRVQHGGSWNSTQRIVRVSYRDSDSPGYFFYRIGFRLVCASV
jgi:formylglycine-generating enzyme required for sulfatase activity